MPTECVQCYETGYRKVIHPNGTEALMRCDCTRGIVGNQNIPRWRREFYRLVQATTFPVEIFKPSCLSTSLSTIEVWRDLIRQSELFWAAHPINWYEEIYRR
jgi:hypothetical protein